MGMITSSDALDRMHIHFCDSEIWGLRPYAELDQMHSHFVPLISKVNMKAEIVFFMNLVYIKHKGLHMVT